MAAVTDVAPDAAQYKLEPDFQRKFRPGKVKEIIAEVLKTRLTGKQYHADNTSLWTREVADDIKHRLKELSLDRFKYVVQVVIGEQRGEGVWMGCRCFWDQNTDNYAQEVFTNEHLFCVAAAFGVYYY